MALLLRSLAQRSALIRGPLPWSVTRSVPIVTTTYVQQKQKEDFFRKNERLARPISPHMTIYAPQITWLLSISHRVSGVVLSGAATSLALGMLLWPGSYASYVEWVHAFNFSDATIFAMKLSLAYPFTFHFCNGIRHLIWDMGHGFELRQVSLTGWTVIVLSTISAVFISCL